MDRFQGYTNCPAFLDHPDPFSEWIAHIKKIPTVSNTLGILIGFREPIKVQKTYPGREG